MAVRAALGASRAQLVRQLLTESLLLASLGCGVGFALGYLGVQQLPRLVPIEIPAWVHFGVDTNVVCTRLVSRRSPPCCSASHPPSRPRERR